MTGNVVYLQPAFVLRQRKYRETSVILDIFTVDYGRISLLARGVRKPKSKTAALLQPFIPLKISFFGSTELKILTEVEMNWPTINLSGMALYCGFYINELVTYFLYSSDPHPEVFASYRQCLISLSDESLIEPILRTFELELIDAIGFGLQFDYDVDNQPIDTNQRYQFQTELGLIVNGNGPYSGASLKAIKNKDFSHPQVLSEAKILMRAVIDNLLQNKPLKSRTVINQVIKHL